MPKLQEFAGRENGNDPIQLELIRYAGNVVTKANCLYELPYRLSPLEQKILIFLISLAQPDDEKFMLYRFSASELIEFLGIKTNNYGEIGRIIRNMKKKSVIIQKENSILDVNWFASAEYYRGGMIELEISQKLAPYLLQLGGDFTSYKLKNIIPLKSAYSIRLYEILKKSEKLFERKYTVDHLKYILQIEEEYKLYGHFKEKVLKVAEKELQEKCDIYFTFEEIKVGRKVECIRFIIRRNKEYFRSEQVPNFSEEYGALYEEIFTTLCIPDWKLEGVFKKYSGDKIEQAYRELSKRLRSQVIKSPIGYFMSLLSHGVFSLPEGQSEQGKEQLSFRIFASEEMENEDDTRVSEMKNRVNTWIVENPEMYGKFIDEEKTGLGDSITSESQAKTIARRRVADLLG